MVSLILQHNMGGVLPRKKQVESLECTTNRIPISKLGKVAYLCRDLPIYEIKTMTPLVHAGQRRKSIQNSIILINPPFVKATIQYTYMFFW